MQRVRGGGLAGTRSAQCILALFFAAVGPCASVWPSPPPSARPSPRTSLQRVGLSGHQCGAAWSGSSFSGPASLDPWTYSPAGGHLPGHVKGLSEDAACRAYEETERRRGGTPEWTRWSFRPLGSPHWLRFDPEGLCKALHFGARTPGRARMLFVGDSLSHHQMLSLMLAMVEYERGFSSEGVAPDDILPTKVPGMQKNDGALLCGGTVWVQQQGSQDLLTDYHAQFVFKEHVPWLQSFDVVVLQLPWQQGTAMSPGVEFWKSIALPHQRLLFRTLTIGHEHAGATFNHTEDTELHPMLRGRLHSEPLRSPQEVVQYFRGQEGHWSWWKLRSPLEHVMAELESEGFAVADYYYLSAMMWYKHRDPLHYCVPGPIDVWNELLFNWIVRGHLCDFQAWSARFSKAVVDLGGLKNLNNTCYGKMPEDDLGLF